MTRPNVYVTRLLPEAGMALVREACAMEVWQGDEPVPRSVLLEQVRDKAGLLCTLSERIDAELLAAAPHLRVVSNYAVGYDNIDVAAATARGVLVCNTPGVLTETTADLAFALLLAAARRLVEGARYVLEGRWRTWGPLVLLGRDVHGATLGIVGLGRIGAAVARRARGFSMRILYTDPLRRPDLEAELGAEYVDLPTLLRQADLVSLHLPLTPETRHLIGREELRLMKPTAVLVNTSRGPVVDTMALYQALRDGTIAYAGLDVTDPEPLPADHPLLTLENVIVVPHVGSATVTTRERMAVMAAENLIAALRGERPAHPVNPEVL